MLARLKYQLFVFACCLASWLCLWQAYKLDTVALLKCGGVPGSWLVFNLVPGVTCFLFWFLRQQDGARRAGIAISSITALLSLIAVWSAAQPGRAAGDMGCIFLFPDGLPITIVVVLGSLIAWISLRISSRRRTVS